MNEISRLIVPGNINIFAFHIRNEPYKEGIRFIAGFNLIWDEFQEGFFFFFLTVMNFLA
jgi:hypothetical protein